MGKAFIRQTEKLSREHKRKHRRRNVVIALAAVVVFGTAYALMLPAVTWDDGLVCGLEEHIHTEECYKEAEKIILENREVLDRVANLLIEKEKIGREEFESCFNSDAIEGSFDYSKV